MCIIYSNHITVATQNNLSYGVIGNVSRATDPNYLEIVERNNEAYTEIQVVSDEVEEYI